MTTPAPDHRRLFGGDPGGYDRAQPDYPSRVYEILTARCGLRSGAATLEIGPGSGLATRRLLALGADPLVAVEPDDRLATYLSRQLRAEGRSIEPRVEAFEEAALDASSFDLVVSATTFHWLNHRTYAVSLSGARVRRNSRGAARSGGGGACPSRSTSSCQRVLTAPAVSRGSRRSRCSTTKATNTSATWRTRAESAQPWHAANPATCLVSRKMVSIRQRLRLRCTSWVRSVARALVTRYS